MPLRIAIIVVVSAVGGSRDRNHHTQMQQPMK